MPNFFLSAKFNLAVFHQSLNRKSSCPVLRKLGVRQRLNNWYNEKKEHLTDLTPSTEQPIHTIMVLRNFTGHISVERRFRRHEQNWNRKRDHFDPHAATSWVKCATIVPEPLIHNQFP